MPIDPAKTALVSMDRLVTLLPADPRSRVGGPVRAISGTLVHTPGLTPRLRAASDSPGLTLVELTDEALSFVDAILVRAPDMPALLLCVPRLVLIIVSVVAIGLRRAAASPVILLAIVPVHVGWRVARRLRQALVAARAPRPRRCLGVAGWPARVPTASRPMPPIACPWRSTFQA